MRIEDMINQKMNSLDMLTKEKYGVKKGEFVF